MSIDPTAQAPTLSPLRYAPTAEPSVYTIHLFPPGDPWHDRWRGLGTYCVEVVNGYGTIEYGGPRPTTERTWKVVFNGRVYAADGSCEWEPLPSARTEKWLGLYRHTLHQAITIGHDVARVERSVLVNEWQGM